MNPGVARAIDPKKEMITASRILFVLRGLSGYTQEQLAARAGLNKTAISDYETGKRVIPDPRRHQLLAALGLPARAWEDTARHLEWLDWLSREGRTTPGPGATSDPPSQDTEPARSGNRRTSRPSRPRREIRHIAEAAGKALERHLVEVLDVVTQSQR